MKKIKGLLLIIFVISLHIAVFARDSSSVVNMPALSVYRTSVYDVPTSGKAFFLLSKVDFEAGYEGTLIALFSDITVDNGFSGLGIAVFSDFIVSENSVLDGNIIRISDFMAMMLFSVLQILVMLVLIQIKKGYFEQGLGACLYDKLSIIRKGLIGYFFVIALITMFLLSVVGYPISVLIFTAAFIVRLCGEASLSMYVGYRLNGSYGSVLSILAGSIIIESICLIPYIGRLYSFVVLPIICIGIEGACIINALLYKKFYTLPKQAAEERAETDSPGSHRDIVFKDLD